MNLISISLWHGHMGLIVVATIVMATIVVVAIVVTMIINSNSTAIVVATVALAALWY